MSLPGVVTALADFEDGGAAVLANHYGQGWCFTFPLSLREAARDCPDLVRDLIDLALDKNGIKRGFDVLGSSQELDLAESASGETRYLAVVNHQDLSRGIKVVPLNLEPDKIYEIKNATTGEILQAGEASTLKSLLVTIPASDFVLLSIVPKPARR